MLPPHRYQLTLIMLEIINSYPNAGASPFFALSAASQLTDDSLEQVALELNLGFCGCPTLRGLCEGWDGFDLLQCLHLKPRNNSLLHQACWSELVETPRPRIASMRSTARATQLSATTIQGARMPNEKTGSAASATRALEPTQTNPLDFVPDKMPFDTPYGPPISLDRAQSLIDAAVAEAKKRNWKMNVAVVDSGGNLVAFQRMDGAMLASIQIAEHKARAAATFRRPTKEFEVGINVMHLNYLLAFDGVIASRGGIPLIEQGAIIGAIGCSGGADSQDEIVSKAGAAVINPPSATNK
jgi:glc operon protein GlcG